MQTGLVVGGLLLFAALLVEQRGLVLQLLQLGLGDGLVVVSRGASDLQFAELLQLRRGQRLALALQAFAAAAQLTGLLVDVAAVCCQHRDLLLHLVDLGALGVGAGLGGAQGVLDIGLRSGLVLGLGRQQFGLLLGRFDLLGDRLELCLRVVVTLLPLPRLGLQVDQASLHPLPAFDDVAYAFFQPTDLERGLGQRALRTVQAVAGGVMRLAHGLQTGLDMAQFGQPRFERIGGLEHSQLHPLRFGGRIAVLEEPELVQLERTRRLQAVVEACDLGLLLKLVDVGVELAQDVVDPGQVLARVLESVLGFAPALLVLGHAGGLFEEQPQFLGSRLDDAADRALADDRVSARPKARAQKDVLHIATAHRLVVDEVAAAALACQHSLDSDVGKSAPLAAGASVLIREHQLDAGAAGRFAQARTVEDHVLHALAAQLAGLALAQHPAHGIHDVGLATAVGTDHADPLTRQRKGGRLSERLEAREFDLVQAHARKLLAARVTRRSEAASI